MKAPVNKHLSEGGVVGKEHGFPIPEGIEVLSQFYVDLKKQY